MYMYTCAAQGYIMCRFWDIWPEDIVQLLLVLELIADARYVAIVNPISHTALSHDGEQLRDTHSRLDSYGGYVMHPRGSYIMMRE